jgi:putative transposase
MREILNAVLYVLSTGCQWRALPKDLPRSTVHGWFVRWHCDGCSTACIRPLPAGSRTGGTSRLAHGRDRRQPERQERRERGRHIDPIGYDAAKKVKGKTRHLIVDTLGLMLGLDVTPADVQDRDGFLPLLKSVRCVFLERLFADGAYSGTDTAAAAKRTGKVALEIVKRSDAAKGFVVVAKRWIVERTFG